jgi:hypothetical protein
VRGAAIGASQAVEAELRPGEAPSPFAVALAQAAELVAAAIVRGASAGIRVDLATCAGAGTGPCGMSEVARTAGHAATAGALDAAEHRVGPWLLGGGIGLAAVILGATAILARTIAKRPVSL